MKTARLLIAAALAVVFSTTVPAPAADAPQIPMPGKEHRWLQRFVGDWKADVKMFAEPGQPPMKGKSTEKFRAVGGFWVQGEGKSNDMGMPFTSVFTIGYDPGKKKYVATWIDSTNSMLWNYTGDVDATGNKLVLETEGPGWTDASRKTRFREVTEFKGKNRKIFTASMLDGGKWVPLVIMDSRRVTSK